MLRRLAIVLPVVLLCAVAIVLRVRSRGAMEDHSPKSPVSSSERHRAGQPGGEETDKYEPLVKSIATQTKTAFRPASTSALASLRDLQVPGAVMQFYTRHEPAECAEGEGAIRLWPIRDMVVENTKGVPGICVFRFGYIVFASTSGGDAYCFNLNRLNGDGEPEIVLIELGSVGEDSKAEEVHPVAKPVARTLREFLTQFSRGEVDQQGI